MKAYKCERCGTLYSQRNDRAPFLIYRPNKNCAFADVGPMQLCEKCSKELKEWITKKEDRA